MSFDKACMNMRLTSNKLILSLGERRCNDICVAIGSHVISLVICI